MPVRDSQSFLFLFDLMSKFSTNLFRKPANRILHTVRYSLSRIVTISNVTVFSILSLRLICTSLTITTYIVYNIKLAFFIVYFTAQSPHKNIRTIVVSIRLHVAIDIPSVCRRIIFLIVLFFF